MEYHLTVYLMRLPEGVRDVGFLASPHKQFADQLREFARVLDGCKLSEEKLSKAHQKMGRSCSRKSKERVPVDTSNLKQRLLTNTYKEGRGVITETGTNVWST